MKVFDIVGFMYGRVGSNIARTWASEATYQELRDTLDALSRGDVVRVAQAIQGGKPRRDELVGLINVRLKKI